LSTFAKQLRGGGIPVRISGVPECIIGSAPADVDDRARPFDERIRADGANIQLSTRHGFEQLPGCEVCPHRSTCPGPATEALDVHGVQDFPKLTPAFAAAPEGLRTDTPRLMHHLKSERICRSNAPFESRKIDELNIMYTLACNLRCDYCWLWGETGVAHDKTVRKAQAEKLGVAELINVVEQAAEYNLRTITISGGEPLLSKSWYPLAKRGRELGLSISLTTSGTLIERNLAEILEVFSHVNVSLHCPPDIAPEVRGGPKGNYDSTIRGMKAISDWRQDNPDKGPRLGLLTTISDTNYSQIAELTSYLREQEIVLDQMYFQFLIFIPPEEMQAMAKILREEYDAALTLLSAFRYEPTGIDFDVMADQIRQIREMYPDARFSAPLDREGMKRYFGGDKFGLVPKYCSTPWTEISLLPNGDICTCPDVVVGNVLKQSLEEIWNGQAQQGVRERVSTDLFPVCTGCFHYWGNRATNMSKGDESRPV